MLMAAIMTLFGIVGAFIGGKSGMFFGGRGGADALNKIRMCAEGRIRKMTAEAHPEAAQMMILNPSSRGGLQSVFSIHPPAEERIARLLAMAGY